MSLSCLSNQCCDSDTINSFKEVCDSRLRVDNTIAAVAIVENDTFPELGDSVPLSTGVVVLDDCNIIESLLQWVRDKQYACEGGGKYYHFFNNGMLAKGTRAKPSQTFSEDGSEYYSPKHLRYETTAELFLNEHYLPNNDVISNIMKRSSSISLIYFFKQGGMILDNDASYSSYISEAGFDVTGVRNEFVSGSITIMEKGNKQPTFRWASNPDAFIKLLKTRTGFSFGANTYTGIAEAACGSSGGCITLEAVTGAPFTITPIVTEAVSCSVFNLYKDCSSVVTDPIVVDSATGVVTAAAGLTAGTYKFTQEVTNDCGIHGSQCFKVIIA
jgi:hypothetical protein